MLMKLRIGIITELLSGIFGISSAQISQIINIPVKMLTATLHSTSSDLLVIKTSDKSKSSNALEDYQYLQCTKCCIEILIERPRDLELHAIT